MCSIRCTCNLFSERRIERLRSETECITPMVPAIVDPKRWITRNDRFLYR